VIVLAGDLGHGVDNFRRCVSCFCGLAPHLAVLAGNHDVWRDDSQKIGSQRLFEQVLPAICADLGACWLETSSLRLGPVGLVGSMAWYDYSAIDPEQQRFAPSLPSLKPMLNNDANWVDWPLSDPQVAHSLGASLLQRVAAAEADPTLQSLVVVSHVPLLEAQMVRKPHDATWGLSNAFFGNLTLGSQLVDRPKISLVVSGHTHFGRQGSLDRPPAPPLRYAVVPSDYGEPAFLTFEV